MCLQTHICYNYVCGGRKGKGNGKSGKAKGEASFFLQHAQGRKERTEQDEGKGRGRKGKRKERAGREGNGEGSFFLQHAQGRKERMEQDKGKGRAKERDEKRDKEEGNKVRDTGEDEGYENDEYCSFLVVGGILPSLIRPGTVFSYNFKTSKISDAKSCSMRSWCSLGCVTQN